MIKKRSVLNSFIVLLSVLMVNLISARTPIQDGVSSGIFGGGVGGTVSYGSGIIRSIGSGFASIFAPIFGTYVTDQFLFAKILLFFLLFSIIYMSLKRVDLFADNKVVHLIVTIIVSILAVRYIPEGGFFSAIMLPYGVLGTAIGILLPMLIFFLFVHSAIPGSFGRRFAWFVYGVIFFVFWGMRGAGMGTANWIYIIGMAFVLFSLIFDKSIHAYFAYSDFVTFKNEVKESKRLQITEDMERAVRQENKKAVKKAWRKLKRLEDM